MNITINPDQEATDALNALVAMRNAALPDGVTPYTTETHLVEVLNGHITQVVADAFELAVQRLGTGARALPYAQRMALIQQVEAVLP